MTVALLEQGAAKTSNQAVHYKACSAPQKNQLNFNKLLLKGVIWRNLEKYDFSHCLLFTIGGTTITHQIAVDFQTFQLGPAAALPIHQTRKLVTIQ
jgi:hypothetical protein